MRVKSNMSAAAYTGRFLTLRSYNPKIIKHFVLIHFRLKKIKKKKKKIDLCMQRYCIGNNENYNRRFTVESLLIQPKLYTKMNTKRAKTGQTVITNWC